MEKDLVMARRVVLYGHSIVQRAFVAGAGIYTRNAHSLDSNRSSKKREMVLMLDAGIVWLYTTSSVTKMTVAGACCKSDCDAYFTTFTGKRKMRKQENGKT